MSKASKASKASKFAGQPRARDTLAVRARRVDELVQEIADAMLAGTWASGALEAELRQREGVGRDAVASWASQAGRLLRMGPDVEARRAINLRRLDETYASAEDAKGRVAAVAEQNRMLGLHAPVRAEITIDERAILGSPTWARIEDTIFGALERHPAARADVERALRALARPQVIDVTPAPMPAMMTEGRGDDEDGT